MKIKKLSAVIAFVLILLSSLSFIPLNVKGAVVESDSEVPIALYFHRNNTMNTTPPAVGVEAKASLKDGESITFFSPELKEDLTVNTIYCNVSFYLEIKVTQVHTPYTDPNETVDVKLSFSFENPELRAEAMEWFEDVIEWSGWKTVNLTYDKTGKATLKKYSNLTLKISSKAVPSSILAYNYNVTLYYDEKNYASQVSFPCSPVTATVTTEGGTEFKPYAPTPEIPFKGNIKDAFDNEDLKEVRLEINGPGYHYTTPPLENITPGDYTYKWNYSGESPRLKAGNYTARLNVITHQHTFYKTTNFTFIACALDSWSNRTYETILVGKSASYAVAIRNTGSHDTTVTINISFDIQIIPGGSHLWNITVFDKDRGVIVGNVSTNASRSLYYDVYNFNGGSTKNLILTVTSADTTIGVDWKCRVDLHARSTTLGHEADAPPVTIFTYIAAPYEINSTWSKRYDYILVNRLYQLELTVINLGSMPDSVEIVLNYTNKAVWNITLEKDIVENLNPYGSPGYFSAVKLNVTANTTAGADNTTLNITAESVHAPPDYKANWTNKTLKYLTLELKRAFGISLLDVVEYTKNVDVKVSQAQAQYTIALETNDEIPHLVRLTANATLPLTATLESTYVEVSKATRKEVILTVTAPKGTRAGSYTTIINVGIEVEGIVSPEHTKTKSVITIVNTYYGMDVVWSDENIKVINLTASPGATITKSLKVTNKGNNFTDVALILAKGWEYASLETERIDGLAPAPNNTRKIDIILKIPSDAKHGQKILIEVRATAYGETETTTLIIEITKTELERFWDILAQMAHFIILLIAVIVVFVTMWLKRRK